MPPSNDCNEYNRPGSEELAGNDVRDFARESVPIARQHADMSSPALYSSPQGTHSRHTGNGSYSPAHSLGSRGDCFSSSQSQNTGERTESQPLQNSRPRATPASNFSALFPAPQAVASFSTDHSTLSSYLNQTELYQQSPSRPSEASSSRGSPFASPRYHPYSQSSGSSAPPSLSHSVSSASHSLVSSRPSSRAVSASVIGSPYSSSHPSSTFPASNFNSSLPSFTSSGSHPGLSTSASQIVPSDQNQDHRSSTNALVPPSSCANQRASAPSLCSATQAGFNSTSASPYYYAFEGEQEEHKPVIPDVDYRHRRAESIGKQEHLVDNPHAVAPLNQPSNTGNIAFETGTNLLAPRFLGGQGKESITGSRALLAPFTSQEHRLPFDRQKSGLGTSHIYHQQPLYTISGQRGGAVTSYRTTMSEDMYQTSVDLDGLESYDDEDVLGGLHRNSYGGGGFSVADSGSGSGSVLNKGHEKNVRRRSSKACTFLGPSRKRGPPKGYIDAIESRLHQTEALVGILLSLANPDRGILDGDEPVPDERARSLLEDLRNNDPLAREIIDRVDRGAYGTKGRKNNVGLALDSKRSSARPESGSGDEKSSGSGGTVKGNRNSIATSASGPPASIQGRGRMVGLGQEMGMGGVASGHPSNEWQDAVAERLKAAARSRAHSTSDTAGTTGQAPQSRNPSDFHERERQRRRVGSPVQQDKAEHSPNQFVHPRLGHSQSIDQLDGTSDPANTIAGATSATRFSPPVAAPYHSSAYSAVGPPPSTASSHSSYVDSGADEVEHVEGEEGITGGVGQLSINEEAQVRFHGKASGLHLLGQKLRIDGRNKGGIWHFPKAGVWPPVAPKSAMHLARMKDAEASERAARARLPPRDVQEHLLQLYFTHVHPFLPVVHKQAFLREFRQMNDERDKQEALASRENATDDLGSSQNSVTELRDRSTSANSGRTEQPEETDKAQTDGTVKTLGPRISTLLLYAMFAIAARYAPVAHGTTASPHQVLLEPSPNSADAVMSKSRDNSANPRQSAESRTTSPSGESSTTSKKSEAESASELERDSELPEPDSGHMWLAGDGFLERAKVLLDKTYANSRPSTCQALILMGYREIGIGAMAQSWLYVGMAVRMAQDLGMHRNSDNWTRDGELLFSPIEQQLRKRIWYSCVVMDKYVSAYIGRPLSIFEADYDTRLPSIDEDEELELWAPNESMPNSILTDPVEAVSAPIPPFTAIPGRIVSCFNESARLSSILAMIMQAIYAVNPVSSRHFEALQLERTLDRWYMDLPEYLRFDTSVRSTNIPPPNVLILHMQYWCVVILLHRPFAIESIPRYVAMHQKRLRPGSPVDQNAYSAAQKNFNLCVSAANHITSIVSMYQEHFCLKRCPVFLSYYIFTAGIMHMTTMATNPNDPQASIGLNKCMEVLKRIEIVWPSAARAWQLLHGAKVDLPDYDLPVARIDRPRKRSADDPIDTVVPGGSSHLHESSSNAATAPQAYASTTANGRYDPVVDITDGNRAFALFNSYSRWTSDGPMGFSSGLSTSVLPQHYSTGFFDERASSSTHRSPVAVADDTGRFSQYWSDYSMGQPSSMLSSMYDLPLLSDPHHHNQQNQHASHGLQQSQSFTHPLYMNDHYNAFDALHNSASDVARSDLSEARTLAQSLKEAAKKNEALDKDVEFKRKNLRKQHLKLLLLYPTSKEAKDAETHIWMQTSYQFISVYKQRLAILDRKLFSPVAQSNKPGARQGPGEGGHVEYRKTLARFRQFLAEEERFYVQLLVRYQSQFGLTETKPALTRTEVLSPDQEDGSSVDSGRGLFPEHSDLSSMRDDERQARLATFTKLLVCLGDISRYREQYNDGGGRPRAGHEEGPPRKTGRGGRRGGFEAVARPRNYTRAKNIYEQARLLLPDDGNASHQLAILSSYQKDSFGSLLHYYRALCVRQPYDTASDNLNTVLKKALDQYRSSKGSAAVDPHAVQKVRVDRFLESVVVLHGLWYLDADEHAARASKHSRHITARFRSLIAEPALPANTVSEVIVMAFSALWKIRMIRDKNTRANRTVIEPLIATHILSLLRALFDAARVQLSVKIEDLQDKGDLGQQITRVFRRILPAIRIASKWLRTNANYLVSSVTSASPEYFKNSIKKFWDSYVMFLTPLSETFPLAKLPELKNPLDEDVDLTGFSPVRKAMFVQPPEAETGFVLGQQDVHPNEEYLMRIWDLLRDAEQITAFERSPVSFSNGKFMVSGEQHAPAELIRSSTPEITELSPPPPPPEPVQEDTQESDDDDDGNTTQTSHTEDDVVREAFEKALRDDIRTDTELDDEEDERIVWSPPRQAILSYYPLGADTDSLDRTHLSPLQKIIQPPHISPHVYPSAQSPTTATASPTRPLPPPFIPSTVLGTTAQDLLDNVLGFSRSKSEHVSFGLQQQQGVTSSTPQSSLLFGSGSFNSPTKSIWSSTGASGQLGTGGHLPPSLSSQFAPSGSLAPGHERARSHSFSVSQSAMGHSQALTSTQDSVYQGPGNVSPALPVEHVGVGHAGIRLGGHHQSLSFSGPQSAFQSLSPPLVPSQSQQVFYDSHPAAPSVQIQDTRLQGYAYRPTGIGVPDPFLYYYDSGGTNIDTFSGMGMPQSASTVNQSIWDVSLCRRVNGQDNSVRPHLALDVHHPSLIVSTRRSYWKTRGHASVGKDIVFIRLGYETYAKIQENRDALAYGSQPSVADEIDVFKEEEIMDAMSRSVAVASSRSSNSTTPTSTPALSFSSTLTTSTEETIVDEYGDNDNNKDGLALPSTPPTSEQVFTTVHSEFGHCANQEYRHQSSARPGSTYDFEEVEPPYRILLTTYISYIILICLGHLRDFLGKRLRPSNYKHLKEKNGYAPLNSDFDSFYTRRLKKRMDDCFSRPVTGVPGRTITLLDRYSEDFNDKFELTGSRTRALNLSSYNYLGFAQARGGCADAVEEGIKRYGVNACGPRLEGGTLDLHLQTEQLVAKFLGQEDALISSMGFATNSTIIPALVTKGCLVISDELNHASIRYGVRLSGANVRMFKHNSMESLESLLREAISQGQPRTHRPWKKILLIVEGLFSMEGTLTNLPMIMELKKRYRFYLFVDEAHSIGALGSHGRGVADYFGVNPRDIDILMGTFTKSFGAAGGYISGNKVLIDRLRIRGYGGSYAESMSPPVLTQIVASMASIMGVSPPLPPASTSDPNAYVHPGPAPAASIPAWMDLPRPLRDGSEGRERLRRLAFNARYLSRGLAKLGFITYGHVDSPIAPLLLFNPGKMCVFSRMMLERRTPIAVVVVAYPATPLVTSRVRFCLSAAHTKEDIDTVLRACNEIGDVLDLKHREGERWTIDEVVARAVELVEMA
ncbi:LCB2 [Sanghuangporus vaninii]